MSGIRSALLVAIAVSLSASTAEAATVERVQRTDPFGSPYDSYFLKYTAAPGEANNLEIRLAPDGVTLSDAGAPIAVKGCDQVDASTARCLLGDSLTVTLGDGDDVARVVDTRPPTDPSDVAREPLVRIEAGAGADTLTGGPGNEVFTDAGAGEADRFTGGGGDDRLSYSGRKQSVRITVGAPGEDIRAGIETFEGGSGNDVLTGDGRPNALWGGPGKDTVRGLGGDDDLDGDAGADQLFGGAGDDSLSGDSYTSGLGRDLLDGGRGDDFLDLGAADDEVLSVGGPTFEVAPDGLRDTAHGGPGYDTLIYDDRGDRLRSCEAATLAGALSVGRTLRRVSPTRLRLRISATPEGELEVTKILLVPPGKDGPRLTRTTRVDDEGTVTLRLTNAGVRYLRRHSAVSITTTDFFEKIAARVVRGRGG